MAKRDAASKKAEKAAPAPTPAPPVKEPTAPEMKDAWARMVSGDNRAARRMAKAVLANASASAEAKEEATDMLARIGYDPGAAMSVIGISLAVLIIAILLTVTHKFD